MSYNYKYMLGTFLAIYAHKYSDFEDIVKLNNCFNELKHKTIYDICLDIGIDLNDEDFLQKLLNAMDEYISTKEIDQTSCETKLAYSKNRKYVIFIMVNNN